MASAITHANWSAVDTPDFNRRFDAAVSACGEYAERVWPMLVDGVARAGTRVQSRVSPGDPAVALGRVALADDRDVSDAIAAADRAYAGWRRLPPSDRVTLIRRVATLIEERQHELAALVSLEIGKNRFEARTEVQEAIELLRFYCDSMESQHALVTEYPPLGDERSVSVGRPYGAWAILGPFNFPFALVAGMASAALVTGNTVVIKPPALAPICGLRVGEICRDAGLPHGVVNVVMGDADVGKALVASGGIAGVGFTGSLSVGSAIRRTLDGKPLVAEMGGKNPALVMASADLDTAAEAVCRSAFRYAGQKCSACARVLVHESLTDALTDAIFERAQRLQIGIPWRVGSTVGPLIDQAAKDRFDHAVHAVNGVARRVLSTEQPRDMPAGSAYTNFAIAVDLPADHELLRRELFAPLLCVQTVSGLEEALTLANDVPYGLTAGLYTSEQAEIDRFLDEIEAGVVYVNRATGATTGAWVGHQSFGGWKGSGSTGANAHGAWYLQQFVREQSRTVVGA